VARNPASTSSRRINPAYDGKRLSDLGDSIKLNGMQMPIIVLTPPKGTPSLLDGRSRLDAMSYVGIQFEIRITETGGVVIDAPGYDIPPASRIVPDIDFNPYAFVLLTNLHRRHLKVEDKRIITRQVINLMPGLTDRAIARMSGVDKNTVKVLRKELANGEFTISERTEASGRKARGRKPDQTKPTTPVADVSTEIVTEPIATPLPVTDKPSTAPIAVVPAKTKPKPVPAFDAEILAAAQKIQNALRGHYSAPNYEAARKAADHLMNLLRLSKTPKPSVGTSARAA
jgi:ParB-like chromosome segregation protein Spo0J